MELEASRKHFLIIQVMMLINALENDLHFEPNLTPHHLPSVQQLYCNAKQHLNQVINLPLSSHGTDPAVITLQNNIHRVVRNYVRLSEILDQRAVLYQ